MFWQMSSNEELDYAIKSISEFLDGNGKDRDWDNFTTYSLKNKALDRIRKEAFDVQLPLDQDGRIVLERLLRDLSKIKPL